MTVLDVHVTVGVDKVKKDKVGSDNCPVHLQIVDERSEECRAEYSNVHKVFMEILDQTSTG